MLIISEVCLAYTLIFQMSNAHDPRRSFYAEYIVDEFHWPGACTY